MIYGMPPPPSGQSSDRLHAPHLSEPQSTSRPRVSSQRRSHRPAQPKTSGMISGRWEPQGGSPLSFANYQNEYFHAEAIMRRLAFDTAPSPIKHPVALSARSYSRAFFSPRTGVFSPRTQNLQAQKDSIVLCLHKSTSAGLEKHETTLKARQDALEDMRRTARLVAEGRHEYETYVGFEGDEDKATMVAEIKWPPLQPQSGEDPPVIYRGIFGTERQGTASTLLLGACGDVLLALMGLTAVVLLVLLAGALLHLLLLL